MPTEWTYHADGVNTAVRTAHRLDGSLKTVTTQLDTFKVREWDTTDPDEVPDHATWDDADGVFYEHGSGANATLTWGVNDARAAELQSITPEDGEEFRPRHMALLPASVRVVENIDGVDMAFDPLETMSNAYHDAGDVHIEKLDGRE